MKQRGLLAAGILGLLLAAALLPAPALAAGAWDETWGFSNPVNATVSYTDADAARYLTYYAETAPLNTVDSQHSLQDYADFAAQRIAAGELTFPLYDAAPPADSAAMDEALCIAYAYVEQTYQVPEAAFLQMMPTVRYRANVNDPNRRVWAIDLQLPKASADTPELAPYWYYFLNLDAQTGMVLDCVDPSVPAAG